MSAGPGGGPQASPDFEEARQVSAEIIAGQRMTMTGPRWMTMYEQKLLAETVDALFSEREAREAAARRVEYAWENLRGWMPNGRGVKNWTREMNDAVAALPAPESAQAEGERDG